MTAGIMLKDHDKADRPEGGRNDAYENIDVV